MPSKKLKNIEDIFNAAEDALHDITIGEIVKDDDTKSITVTAEVEYEIDTVTEDEMALTESGGIFELKDLKRDFIVTKRSLRKLTLQLQTMMDSAGELDVEDMSGQKVMAIAQIAAVTSQTLKDMIELYRSITEIQNGLKVTQQPMQGMMVAGDLNQNIIYAGNTADLLESLNEVPDVEKTEEV